MAFTDDKYHITFLSRNGQTWLVEFYLDGYVGASTALTPSGDPLVLRWGDPSMDIYEPLLPSVATIQWRAADTTVIDEIFADHETEWQIRIKVNAVEQWRGYVNTDDIQIPLSNRGVHQITASCGLARLSQYEFSDTAWQTFILTIGDVLANIDNSFNLYSLCNWHAYSNGTTVQGDTLGRYEINTVLTSDNFIRDRRQITEEDLIDTDVETPIRSSYERKKALTTSKKMRADYVLAQLVGRFGCRIMLNNGHWSVVQRELCTGGSATYTSSRYNAAGSSALSDAAVVGHTLGTDSEIADDGAFYNGVLPYSEVAITYDHGFLGDDALLNTSFEDWTAGVPDNWTAFGGPTLTQDNAIDNVFNRAGTNDYAVGIDVEGSQPTTVSLSNEMTKGIYQETSMVYDSGTNLEVRFKSQLVWTTFPDAYDVGSTVAAVGYQIEINPSAGASDYWNAIGQKWQTSAVINPLLPTAPAAWEEHRVVMKTTGKTGTLVLRLYNPTNAGTGFTLDRAIYDDVQLIVKGTSRNVLSTTTSVAESGTGATQRRQVERFLIGDGPTDLNVSRVTYDDAGTRTRATGWKAGDYAGGASPDATTGYSLDELHARQFLRDRLVNRKQLNCNFYVTGAAEDYWPAEILSYDSVDYSCHYLEWHVWEMYYRFSGTEVTQSALASTAVTTTYSGNDRESSNGGTSFAIRQDTTAVNQSITFNGLIWEASPSPSVMLYAQTATEIVANTVTETTLTTASGSEGSLAIPADAIAAGTVVVVDAAGTFVCNAAGTLTLKLKLTDETPTTVTLATTAAVDLSDNAATRGWTARFLIAGRTAGASGSVYAHGAATFMDAANTDIDAELQAGQTSTVDTTDENDLDLTATWSSASASLSISCTIFNVSIATAG